MALGAAFVGTGIAALTPLVQKVIVDDVILSDQRPLAPWLALLLAAGVVRFAASFVRRFVGGRVSFDVQHDLRTAIYRHLQRLDFASHDRLQTGQLVSRASADVGLIQGILSFLPIVIGNFLLFVVSLVVMVFLSPLLTLVALAVAPLLGLVALRMRRTVFPASWDAQQQAGVVAGVVDEAVVGVRVVKGFGQEERELAKLTDAARRPVRPPPAHGPHPGPLPADAADDPGARPGRRSWPSAAGWPSRATSASARSWPSRPTSAS